MGLMISKEVEDLLFSLRGTSFLHKKMQKKNTKNVEKYSIFCSISVIK